MSITRWDPWTELATMQRDLIRSSTASQPAADVFRTDEAFVVRIDVPGVREQDLSVQTEDGRMIVSAERGSDPDVDRDHWVRRERPTGQFTRTFSLPEGADPEKITANLEWGVLELRIPHAPERQPRQIPVRAASDA
ncbi:MAG TPA: Hsp20/alpha crystallin family protein [Euzebya sp.]|nr:Hsp20/alpha crystallin family protein [Euzebya sp.]